MAVIALNAQFPEIVHLLHGHGTIKSHRDNHVDLATRIGYQRVDEGGPTVSYLCLWIDLQELLRKGAWQRRQAVVQENEPKATFEPLGMAEALSLTAGRE
jgi:hypothetical protein